MSVQVAKYIILYITDALVQILDQCAIGIIEILHVRICTILEIKRAIIEQTTCFVADCLDLIAIVRIHQVVNETKGSIVLLAISLQTLYGTIRRK